MRALIWALGWIGIVLSLGFAVGQTDNNNYNLINATFPKHIWAIIFAVYGSILIYRCLYRIDPRIMGVIYIIGVWSWSYVFFSFVVFDPTPAASTEWMLIFPIIGQVWIFFNLVWHKKPETPENNIFEVMRHVRHDIKSLSNDLLVLSQKNVKMKYEFGQLCDEVNRIRDNITKERS